MDSVSDDNPGKTAAVSVFLSYSSEDREQARAIVAALEANGCAVWWDRLLAGGDVFSSEIEAALATCDVIVVLWSAHSVNSHWVLDEASLGRDRGRLVPVSIDGTQPPLGFRQINFIDLAKWRGRPGAKEMGELIAAVRSAASAPAFQRVARVSAAGRASRRGLILAGAGSIAVLGAGLAAWKGGLFKSVPPNSVAVLPFQNLSGDKDQDYFSDGLTEQIRSTLSHNGKLRVMAPASTVEAMKGDVDPKVIAGKLGIAYLLDGSVRRSGDVIRIVARLTDATSGVTAWSDQMDRQMSDVFAVQEDIAGAVAEALAAQTANVGAVLHRQEGGTSSGVALDAFLRGQAYKNLRSGEAAYRAALAQYDAAIAADPNYAEAHAERAYVIVARTLSFAKADEFAAAYADALASARRAVTLAPRSAIAQARLGYVLSQGKLDLRAARAPYEVARRLGFGDAEVMRLVAIYFAELALKGVAESAIARALNLDPLNAGVYKIAAFVAYSMRDYARALKHCDEALSLNPRISTVHAYRGDSLLQLGRHGEARDAYRKETTALYRLSGLAIAERKLGHAGEAKAACDALVAMLGDGATYQRAQIFAQWGQLDDAMAKLVYGRRIGDVGLVLARTDPLLDPLRVRPEFSRLLNELGFD